jgi:RHS repeat-associated protein
LNQYTWWAPVSNITYDDTYYGGPGNGVLMQEGWITATYNALNQPKSITVPGYGSDFMWLGYDPLGRCVKRWKGPANGSASAAPIYYYFDGWNLIEEGTSPWSPARYYVHGAQVDELATSHNSSTGQIAYHHFDARGHCNLLTNASGGILEQYEYDAFGFPRFFSSTAQSLNSSTFGNRFLFTGREWLSDLRLFDFRARMYQPELGRFLQPDPKHFAAGDYNLYRYCHNDPINKTDPTGMADLNYAESTDVTRAYNPENTFVIVGHGNPVNGLVVNKEVVSAGTIAKDAIANGYNSQCAKVEIVICGSGTGGKDSLAQKVANALAKLTGAHVEASAPNGKDSLTGTKNNETGVVTPNSPAALPDPKFGTPGKIETFKADPPKKNKKDE